MFFDLIVAILDQDQQVHISIKAPNPKGGGKMFKAVKNKSWEHFFSEFYKRGNHFALRRHESCSNYFNISIFFKAWKLLKICQKGGVEQCSNVQMFKICRVGSCENLQLEFLRPAVGSKALREIFSVDSSLAGLKSWNLAIIGQSNNQLSWQTLNEKMVSNEFCLWVDG